MGDMSVFGVLRAVEGFETGTALLEGSNVSPRTLQVSLAKAT